MKVSRENIEQQVKQRKFPQEVMFRLVVCSENVSPIVIVDNSIVNRDRYIRQVLSMAVDYVKRIFGIREIFQRDVINVPHPSDGPKLLHS
jgi:hypothetical protein